MRTALSNGKLSNGKSTELPCLRCTLLLLLSGNRDVGQEVGADGLQQSSFGSVAEWGNPAMLG
ncbi:MAG: hypothetical protein CBD74_01575 [Saprospirales bacterium TMED214]|nr:MAG: hypothetical protein CBD74_01575 [Saprospirales bacterium TMED214]